MCYILNLECLVTEEDSVVTLGVAKEVNYALKVKKKVYELKETELNFEVKMLKATLKVLVTLSIEPLA